MRRRTLRVPTLCLALALAAMAVPATPAAAAGKAHAACASGHVHPAQLAKRQARAATLCLINRERRRRGLRPLRLHRRLTVASVRHSRDMVRRNFFAHGNFVARVLNARYVRRRSAWALGENIAWGSGRLATPRAIVRAWMRSPGHRRNILSRRFRDIGIGIVAGAPHGGRAATPGATYTTDFGRKG
jgi:uncharacterized protein YkwD